MDRIVNDAALDILFRAAAMPRVWIDRPVSDTLLRAIWELVKLAPAESGASPTRILFVKSAAAKARLEPAFATADRAAAAAAPVVAVIGCAAASPADPGRNALLQGAALILAARALGLDCALLAPRDHAAATAALPDSGIRSVLVCALGYGAAADPIAAQPRPGFDEACRIL